MSAGRIYGPKDNPRINKVLIAAKLSGTQVDHDANFEFGVDNKSSDYLAKFPLGQTPAFESTDGLRLTESSAIAFYLASLKDNNLILGKDQSELGKVYQFAFFAETQVVPPILSLLLPVWGKVPYEEAVEKVSYQKLDRSLSYLEDALSDKLYLVGDHITLADIFIAEDLTLAFSSILHESYRNKYPNLTKFFLNYHSQPEVKSIDGEVKLADKPLQVVSKA